MIGSYLFIGGPADGVPRCVGRSPDWPYEPPAYWKVPQLGAVNVIEHTYERVQWFDKKLSSRSMFVYVHESLKDASVIQHILNSYAYERGQQARLGMKLNDATLKIDAQRVELAQLRSALTEIHAHVKAGHDREDLCKVLDRFPELQLP